MYIMEIKHNHPQTQSNIQILDKENPKGKDKRHNGIQLESIEVQSSTTNINILALALA